MAALSPAECKPWSHAHGHPVPGNQKQAYLTAGAQGKFVKLKKIKNIWSGMITGTSIIIAFGGTGLPFHSWPELHSETVSKTKTKKKARKQQTTLAFPPSTTPT